LWGIAARRTNLPGESIVLMGGGEIGGVAFAARPEKPSTTALRESAERAGSSAAILPLRQSKAIR